MARRVRNSKVDSRSARSKLPKRREPYWTAISSGCALGYRHGAKGGTWIAKLRTDDGKRHYAPLGAADDVRDPDGLTVFDFAQAQERARAFFADKARALAGMAAPANGPYTVNRALDEYFAERERRGSKGVHVDRYSANARIRPALGQIEVRKLTAPRIRHWQAELEKAPKLLRASKIATTRKTIALNPKDPDAVRARKASANRVLTILKAALTFAYQEGKTASDEAWRKIKPAREVDAPLIQFLTPAECVRLVNACQGAFRDLLRGALVTGCRYGELCRLRVGDFSREAGTITIQQSKSGKRRHVALNDEGRQLFSTLTAGKSRGDLIFTRDDGKPWGASHQQRPLDEASTIAKLDPPATFHILRHTYASALAAKGVPMRVIAEQLGHADTRITERHYAHLAPSHVADVVRAALPGFGIIEQSNIAAIDR
ncbi:MAG TPA: tyrosine-type recombinase/integrase [Methylovirgula sp.]|nr:tyrosine-type recombinase/integrase [Methylovirgula sp.]